MQKGNDRVEAPEEKKCNLNFSLYYLIEQKNGRHEKCCTYANTSQWNANI